MVCGSFQSRLTYLLVSEISSNFVKNLFYKIRFHINPWRLCASLPRYFKTRMDNEKESAAENAKEVRGEGNERVPLKELEYQYSPSKWSKRLDPEKVIQAHVELCRTASQKARESIPHETLRYGTGKNQKIDIFGTSSNTGSQIFVYVHGGYWQELDRSMSAYVVEPLVKNGIRAAVVGYDLVPNVKLDEIVEEMKELDIFLTSWSANNGVRHIWYAGHSAGAYLIASLLKSREGNSVSGNLIAGIIFISGIYNLVPLVDTYVNDKLRLTRDEARKLSLTNVNLKNHRKMKILVVVAENDSPEFIKQSQQFHEMLAGDIPGSECVVIKERDHFDVVEKLNDDQYELTRKIINMILNTTY